MKKLLIVLALGLGIQGAAFAQYDFCNAVMGGHPGLFVYGIFDNDDVEVTCGWAYDNSSSDAATLAENVRAGNWDYIEDLRYYDGWDPETGGYYYCNVVYAELWGIDGEVASCYEYY